MPSIADQTVEQLGGPASVLARQRRDHVELDRLLDEVQRTTGDDQADVLTRIWRLVFRHAYAEETVLWPAVRAAVPNGDALTLRVEQEHQEINELASALERTHADARERAVLVDRLVELLRQDVRDEEDLLLPRLQEALDVGRLRQLGRGWGVVRRIAPTRPHAVVSRRPPGNLLSAVPLALLDHSRDGLDLVARRTGGPLRAAAAGTSRALAGVAGAVERRGPLQVGEDPTTRAGRTPAQP